MKTQDKEPEVDPFLCRCRKCRLFWQKSFHSGGGRRSSLLSLPPEERAAKTSMMYAATRLRENHPAVLKVGDRVSVRDTYVGVVKFVGILDEHITAPDTYVGIKTDDHIGSHHNGVYKGRRFFHCPRGHGLMVKYADVIRINPPEKCPPITGNPMFPSYAKVKQRRLERNLTDPDNDLGWDYKPKPTVYIFDKNDIAAKDIKRREQREKKRQQQVVERERNRKVREDAASEQNLTRWKDQFGGGSQGEKMAKTLQKLHLAYDEGIELMNEKDESLRSETESMFTDYDSLN